MHCAKHRPITDQVNADNTYQAFQLEAIEHVISTGYEHMAKGPVVALIAVLAPNGAREAFGRVFVGHFHLQVHVERVDVTAVHVVVELEAATLSAAHLNRRAYKTRRVVLLDSSCYSLHKQSSIRKKNKSSNTKYF